MSASPCGQRCAALSCPKTGCSRCTPRFQKQKGGVRGQTRALIPYLRVCRKFEGVNVRVEQGARAAVAALRSHITRFPGCTSKFFQGCGPLQTSAKFTSTRGARRACPARVRPDTSCQSTGSRSRCCTCCGTSTTASNATRPPTFREFMKWAPICLLSARSGRLRAAPRCSLALSMLSARSTMSIRIRTCGFRAFALLVVCLLFLLKCFPLILLVRLLEIALPMLNIED